jgi:hypothetical protein
MNINIRSSLLDVVAAFVVVAIAGVVAIGQTTRPTQSGQQPAGQFVSLFNGKDLSGWKIPEGDNGHWKVVDGVIDYDAMSEAKGEKSLYTEKSYGDFTLKVEWRIKDTPYINPNVPIIKPDGTHKKGVDGRDVRMSVPDSDSGILFRSSNKAQVNIWCWPIGSGEVYGYRMDEKMPASVRAGVTPLKNADKNVGEWNAYEITVRGTRLTVLLNGVKVIDNADLPELPPSGPVGLQHHGAKKGDTWTSPPALVQFRNISIAELK